MPPLETLLQELLIAAASEDRVGKAGRPREVLTGFEKAEISAFLAEGERISHAYIVERPGTPGTSAFTPSFEYRLFIRITGLRGYYAYLEATHNKQPRIFRSLDRILKMLRGLGYGGPIVIYNEDDSQTPPANRGTLRRPGDRAQTSPRKLSK